MKKIFILIVLLSCAGPLMAYDTATEKPHWFFQVQGGEYSLLSSNINAMSQNPVTFNSPGWGFNCSLGYAFSNDFSLSALIGYQVATVSNSSAPATYGISMAYIPIQLAAQANLLGTGPEIYGLLGVGLALNNYNGSIPNSPVDGVTSYNGISETDLLLSPGLGFSLNLGDNVDLFLQAKLDFDFFSQKFASWFSNLGGSTKNFDTPQIYLPIQLGLNFSLK